MVCEFVRHLTNHISFLTLCLDMIETRFPKFAMWCQKVRLLSIDTPNILIIFLDSSFQLTNSAVDYPELQCSTRFHTWLTVLLTDSGIVYHFYTDNPTV